MELIRKVLELFDSFQGRLFRYALAFSLLLTIAPILIAVILVFKYVVIINEGAYQFLVEILILFLSGQPQHLFLSADFRTGGGRAAFRCVYSSQSDSSDCIFCALSGGCLSCADAVSAVLADHGFRIGHSIVHGDLPCVVILSSSAVVWPGRFFVQCKRLCASRYAADMDAGNVHFLSDGLRPFGIVYDFTVVNLHNRLYYISRLLYQCGD